MQWEGMGDVGSARYEPALLPPCPTIRVINYSNCQRSTHSISKSIFRNSALQGLIPLYDLPVYLTLVTRRAPMKSLAASDTPAKYSSGKQKSRRMIFEHVSSTLSSKNGDTPDSKT